MSGIVGIDIAKHSFDIATQQANGKYRTKAKLANSAAGFQVLQEWLLKYSEPGAWIVMEATGTYHEALAEYFHGLGYRVCVTNPAQIALYARSQLQRVKTDQVDAKLIADYGARHVDELRAWRPEPPAIRRLRALVRRLQDLQEIAQMERNRLDVADVSVQDSIRSVLQHIEQQIAETLKAIQAHIDDDPDLRGKRDLLTSIDGVADKTAALLLAELGDPLQFKNARAITAFAGLNPQLRESGTQKAYACISRMGSSRLRAGLYMPAIVALTHNPAIKALGQRLRSRGKAGKQIVCAAMRKLLHIAYGVLKSGQPFDAKLALAH
ncbi:IS110 family transposase [Pseudomonas sp. BN417]|uniref:IS110 family transposase n=1 Tax=Pseudomonas sp. BN417 TaxID=2567890 RepID=UPI00245856DB|nr:IS110 family transposase [Pseudomonas sp. BN417]MDH4554239.1 IS110 family transposase [Pseudomonas sp. BN417]MDH4555836.1 IS110 family transposase [Pseudomonas sp. BN417]MDH4556082.1 IS110 family transposase [Pseudomonas sp. BN417]MDH4556256.1 IS110 family transposase [Pseudomonas sp. BN417]MDH4556423.1 IS110 family transposase [Pseudomonas sp. BN417]